LTSLSMKVIGLMLLLIVLCFGTAQGPLGDTPRRGRLLGGFGHSRLIERSQRGFLFGATLFVALVEPMTGSFAWRNVRCAGCNQAIPLVTAKKTDTATPVGLASTIPPAEFCFSH
jgi:hypothetical protein